MPDLSQVCHYILILNKINIEPKLGKGHGHSRSRMDAIVQNMFEINFSQLIQYGILEKLVTYIFKKCFFCLILNQISAFFSFSAQKILEMTILTSVWGALHPNAGRNIQQIGLGCFRVSTLNWSRLTRLTQHFSNQLHYQKIMGKHFIFKLLPQAPSTIKSQNS